MGKEQDTKPIVLSMNLQTLERLRELTNADTDISAVRTALWHGRWMLERMSMAMSQAFIIRDTASTMMGCIDDGKTPVTLDYVDAYVTRVGKCVGSPVLTEDELKEFKIFLASNDFHNRDNQVISPSLLPKTLNAWLYFRHRDDKLKQDELAANADKDKAEEEASFRRNKWALKEVQED